MTEKILLVLASSLVCAFGLLGFAPQALLAQANSSATNLLAAESAGFAALDAGWEAALAAVVTADQAHLPGPAPYVLTAFDTYGGADGEWALAVIVPSAVVQSGWETLDLDQLVDVLLLRTPDGRSTGHVRTHPAFPALAQTAPRQLIDYAPIFAAQGSMGSALLPETVLETEGYRFPWTAGQTWWLGGGWHSGYGANALDFGPFTGDNPGVNSAVLAAAGGTLRMACQNDSEQRLLWIEHPGGERTGYLHLDRASVAAAVEEKGLAGQYVAQGTLLGTLYRGEAKIDGSCPASFPNCTFNTICGYGNAPHLHFVLPSREVVVDGIAASILGSGAAGSRFTSTNMRQDTQPVTPTATPTVTPTVTPIATTVPTPAPDVEPPTALLVQPSSDSSLVVPGQDAALAVQLVVTDTGDAASAGSGVASVQVQLAWQQEGGAWLATGWVEAAPGPGNMYAAAFDACTPAWRVPHNRPLRVSLLLADAAGNRLAAEAGTFRYTYPDLNRDCVVEIKDIFDLLPALRGEVAARPEHDVDGSGGLDTADAAALLEAVYSGLQARTAPTNASGQAAAVLPGLGSRVQFTSLPGVRGVESARDIAVSGKTALAADWQAGSLALVDLSRPLSPTLVVTLPLGDRVYAAAVGNGSAFAGDTPDGQPARLSLFHLGQPLTATLAATYTLPGEAMESAVLDDRLYLAAGYAGLLVIDVSALQTPTLLGTFDTPGIAADVYVTGSLTTTIVYVADQQDGLRIYRSSEATPTSTITGSVTGSITGTGTITPVTPLTPSASLSLTLLSAWDTPGDAIGVTAALSTVYVADGLGGVQIVDASDPSIPRLLSTFTTASAANSVVISGTTLYAAAGWQGVLALDVSDPAAPYLAGSFDTPGYAHDLALAGDLLLVADGRAGLQVLQVAQQAAPAHVLLIPLAAKE